MYGSRTGDLGRKMDPTTESIQAWWRHRRPLQTVPVHWDDEHFGHRVLGSNIRSLTSPIFSLRISGMKR